MNHPDSTNGEDFNSGLMKIKHSHSEVARSEQSSTESRKTEESSSEVHEVRRFTKGPNEPRTPPYNTLEFSVSQGVVSEEHAGVKSGSCCYGECWLKTMDPRVLDLVYWKDIKKTGVVFGSLLLLLVSLALFSVLSVVAYLSLAVLAVSMSYVVYKKILMAIQKMGSGHPFQDCLGSEVKIKEDRIHEASIVIVHHCLDTFRHLRRLFLIEDVVASIKFGLLLWFLTCLGACFNGITLVILGVIGVFTLPKVYQTYQVQINHAVNLTKTHIGNTWKKVLEKIPLKKKSE